MEINPDYQKCSCFQMFAKCLAFAAERNKILASLETLKQIQTINSMTCSFAHDPKIYFSTSTKTFDVFWIFKIIIDKKIVKVRLA